MKKGTTRFCMLLLALLLLLTALPVSAAQIDVSVRADYIVNATWNGAFMTVTEVDYYCKITPAQGYELTADMITVKIGGITASTSAWTYNPDTCQLIIYGSAIVGVATIDIEAVAQIATPKDNRTEVSRVTMTSSYAVPLYGDEVVRAYTWEVTEGKQARVLAHMGNWFRKEGEQWIRYDEAVFREGTYFYQVQLRVDGDYGESHRLSTDGLTLTVNGEAWAPQDIGVYDGYSYTFMRTPDIEIEWRALPLVFADSNRFDIPMNYAGRAITPYSLISAVTGGVLPYTFSKVSGPDWITVSADGTVSGTPTSLGTNEDLVLRVTDAEGQYEEITATVSETFTNPSDRVVVSTITITSNDFTTPTYASVYNVSYSFTVAEGEMVRIMPSMSRWQRWNGSDWVAMGTGESFMEGRYRFYTQLRVDNAYGRTHVLAGNGALTASVNGTAWEVADVGIYDEYSYTFIYSPAIEVTKPPVTELLFWDSAALDVPDGFCGVAMKPIDLAAATEGGLAPYTYTLYQAPSWLHVDAEGKLYGTPSATDTARTMTIRVTDAEGSYKEVNINVGRVYPNPADREVVSELTATATIPTPALGENVVQIDFEVPTDAPYRFAGGTDRGWYRKEGDTWVRYTATKFIEGTYRYQNLVLIDGGKGLTHRLDENVTLTLNGIPVTLENVTVENASSSVLAIFDSFVVHEFSDYIAENGAHYRVCVCGERTDEGTCTGGTATCTALAVCATCGNTYGTLAEHVFSQTWSAENGTHWRACVCGERTDEGTCAGGSATCTALAACATCGNTYGTLAEHVFSQTWSAENSTHWRACVCGERTDEGTCAGGSATCAAAAVCDTCGNAHGEPLAHTFGEWQQEIPATTEQAGTKAHKDCSVCKKHFDASGKEITDLTIAKLVPEEPDGGLGAGAVIGIVIGAVAVVGIGGFAIFWFVIKKRSFADLLAIFRK